jgi:hypothetical protein
MFNLWMFSKLFGGKVLKPIDAVGNVLNEVFSSDDEKLDKTAILAKMSESSNLLNKQINLAQANSRSLFVSGWRPLVGWVCCFNLIYIWVIRDLISLWLGLTNSDYVQSTPIGLDMSFELLIAMLGFGGLRTIEKLNGRTK